MRAVFERAVDLAYRGATNHHVTGFVGRVSFADIPSPRLAHMTETAAKLLGKGACLAADKFLLEPVPSPEAAFQARIGAFQDSMTLRIPEYELEHAARKKDWDPGIYKLEHRLGVVQNTALDDALKWMEIAREEEHPHASAGTTEMERIHNITAHMHKRGLSNEAANQLWADLYEYFEIALPIANAERDLSQAPWSG